MGSLRREVEEFNAERLRRTYMDRRPSRFPVCRFPAALNEVQECVGRVWLEKGAVALSNGEDGRVAYELAAAAARAYAKETGTPPHLVRRLLLENTTPPSPGSWADACTLWIVANQMDVRIDPTPEVEINITETQKRMRTNWAVVTTNKVYVSSRVHVEALETMRRVSEHEGAVWRIASAVALAIYLKAPKRAAAVAADLESLSGSGSPSPTIKRQFEIVRNELVRYAEAELAQDADALAAELASIGIKGISPSELAALSAVAE